MNDDDFANLVESIKQASENPEAVMEALGA